MPSLSNSSSSSSGVDNENHGKLRGIEHKQKEKMKK